MKILHHQPQRQKSCWRLEGIVVIRHVFSSVSSRTFLIGVIVLLQSRTSFSSTRQFSNVLPSPLMPMIGFVPSSVSLRHPMLLQVIVCYLRHTFWKVLLFSGGRTSWQYNQLVTW